MPETRELLARAPRADGHARPGAGGTATLAIDDLITQHLPLVGHIARETAARLPRHLGTDDLIGAGSLALVQSAQTFDPELGVPFARFANTRIRGAMLDTMRQRDWASRTVRSRSRAIDHAAESLTNGLGRKPTDSELATAAGLTVSEVREARTGADRAVLLSLDPLTVDDEGLGGTLADPAPRPEEALVAAERLGYLRDAIAELPERLRQVVTEYYLDGRPLTEIAESLGVTQSRASQLRSEGLDLLREALQALWVATPGGPGEQQPDRPAPSGTRDRRRQAYVQAVAARSTPGNRANVKAYLDGGVFDRALT